MNSDQESEIKQVLSFYSIGDLVEHERDRRGYINTSFAIKTILGGKKRKFFLRRYKLGTQKTEVEFEHSIIHNLIDKKIDLVANLINTTSGGTFVERQISSSPPRSVYYAIFEFLAGEDKYTWVDPHCSPIEIEQSAFVLAQYHNAVNDFSPKGRRFGPKIKDLPPQIKNSLHQMIESTRGTVFDTYFRNHTHVIEDSCTRSAQLLREINLSKLPSLIIHGDFHPGNLKFEGEQIVGLFDFDWAKIDFRVFDVALALWYFFTDWKGNNDGVLRFSEGIKFIKVYQSSLEILRMLKPLNRAELHQLPLMISLGNLYVLNWTLTDFYSANVDPEEYLIYLKHSVNFIRWFNESRQESLQDALLG